MSQGHIAARKYPLWLVWSEARIVRRRMVELIRTDAIVMQQIIVTALVGGNDLRVLLERLDNGE